MLVCQWRSGCFKLSKRDLLGKIKSIGTRRNKIVSSSSGVRICIGEFGVGEIEVLRSNVGFQKGNISFC